MAIREIITPYMYSGAGRVLISERLSTGEPKGYRDLGKVSKLDMVITENVLEHFNSQNSEVKRDKMHSLNVKIDLELHLEHLITDNVALLYQGGVTEMIASITHEKILQVIPGLSYGIGRVKVSEVVVTNLAGTITYVVDSNYTLDTEVGSIIITEDQTGAVNEISVDDVLVITCAHDDQKSVVPFTSSGMEYCLRFEGLNTSESDTPVVLECFRVSQGFVTQLARISNRVVQAKLPVALLNDPTKPEGEQFFRELAIQ